MKFHIVRTGETVEDILFIYNLTKAEIVEENQHIRSWEKLIPGTKLKIPAISEATELEISEMEPFVEDYYPKLAPVIEEEEKIIKEAKEENIDATNTKEQNDGSNYINSSNIYSDYPHVENNKAIKKTEDKEQVALEKSKEPANEFNLNNSQSYVIAQTPSMTIPINQIPLTQVPISAVAFNPLPYLPSQPIYNLIYPNYSNQNNNLRYIHYPIIYYPIYYSKRSQ